MSYEMKLSVRGSIEQPMQLKYLSCLPGIFNKIKHPSYFQTHFRALNEPEFLLKSLGKLANTWTGEVFKK